MSAVDDLLRGIRVDGEALTALYDQWIPQEIVALDDDIRCLTLSDAMSGRQAVWYLDGENHYCGSHIEVVQRLHPQQILSAVAPWFDELARHSLSATPTALQDAPRVPLFLATQLAAAWCVRVLTDMRQIQTSLAEQDQEIATLGERTLSSRQIRRLLGTRIGPESLVVLSPLSDRPLRSQISFVIEHQLVHRFYDPEADCSFYLSWWERQLDKSPSFYCPKTNLLVSDENMAGMLPAMILAGISATPIMSRPSPTHRLSKRAITALAARLPFCRNRHRQHAASCARNDIRRYDLGIMGLPTSKSVRNCAAGRAKPETGKETVGTSFRAATLFSKKDLKSRRIVRSSSCRKVLPGLRTSSASVPSASLLAAPPPC